MHSNRSSFDDTILILFLAHERKIHFKNEYSILQIFPTMADTQKTCSITRILITFPSHSASRIFKIELFIPGSVLGEVSISWQWKTKLIYATTHFGSDLCSLLGCMKFCANLVTKTSIFEFSDSNTCQQNTVVSI